MQDKKWEFLVAKSVYIYPSANADDGGDINEEKNIAEITNKLIQKNFVIRRNQSDTPLLVTSKSLSEIQITPGEAVIEGYYLNLTSDSNTLCEITIDSSVVLTLDQFVTDYRNYLNQYNVLNPDSSETKSKFNKEDYKEFYNNLPKLYVIIKLLQNITGNVRGDISEYDPISNTSIRICKGIAISVCTSDELAQLDIPYLELAYILPEYRANDTVFNIYKVINDDSRYSYIHESSIYNDDNITIQEWVENYVQQELRHLDTITYYKNETVGDKQITYKSLELTVRNGRVHTIRYQLKTPISYDEDGEPIVTEDTNYDNSYDIDELQKRTHISSSSDQSDTVNDPIANLVDSNDNGHGEIQSDNTDNTNPTINNNGKSKLLARADHIHDERYIRSKSADTQDITQEVGTSLDIDRGLSVSNKKFKVDKDSGDIESPQIKTDSTAGVTTINGKLVVKSNAVGKTNAAVTVEGDLAAKRVYNAVWNDIAELFLKDNPCDNIEPGTVIAKLPGKDTYAPVNQDNQNLVVGVCSNMYGYLLGGDMNATNEENLQKYIPVSLAGRVYVRMDTGFKVNEGDFLTAYNNGLARPLLPYSLLSNGTIIGKALESSDGSKDKILMMVLNK